MNQLCASVMFYISLSLIAFGGLKEKASRNVAVSHIARLPSITAHNATPTS